MSHDDLDHIPSIVPTRDGGPPPGPGRPRPGKASSAQRPAVPKGPATVSAGAGPMARVFIALALVVAAVACAWAWQLQQALQESAAREQDYASRIGDLEARLSDTDQGMNQNAEVQAAKIRELDTEVRKLWDNVWKQASERLARLEKDAARRMRRLATWVVGSRSSTEPRPARQPRPTGSRPTKRASGWRTIAPRASSSPAWPSAQSITSSRSPTRSTRPRWRRFGAEPHQKGRGASASLSTTTTLSESA